MAKEGKVQSLTLDVLIPHRPNIVEFGNSISGDEGIESVDVSVYAMDEKTQSLKVVLVGRDINIEQISKHIEQFGGVIHSIDKVLISKEQQ